MRQCTSDHVADYTRHGCSASFRFAFQPTDLFRLQRYLGSYHGCVSMEIAAEPTGLEPVVTKPFVTDGLFVSYL